MAPGVYPPVPGADKIMANLIMLNDPSPEQLAKLQAEFRQLFVAK